MPNDVNIIRSPKRKRTVALRVERDGTVTVMAPVRTSLKWIHDFIAQRSNWIDRRRQAAQKKRERRTAPILSGTKVPYLGRALRLEIKEGISATSPSLPASGETEDDVLYLELTVPPSSPALEEEIKTELKLWYKKQARHVFAERLAHWSQEMGLKPARFVITAPLRQWGSCTAKNDIRLNWRLIMAPSELLDYVIVHELAHIPHKHHGPRFWRCVEKTVPDWKARRHALHLWEKDPFHQLF